MKITAVSAFPLSVALPASAQVNLGIGRTIKRDTVLVRVETDAGASGWGEAHAGRAPTVIAELIETTLRPLALGWDPEDIDGLWQRIYRAQLASHGTGAAAALALSGLDMALWDLRGKSTGKSLVALLGGTARALPAYAGGISFGYGSIEALLEEARAAQAIGYRALKLRVGFEVGADIARVQAVRDACGADLRIMVDANCAYTLPDARRARAAFDELAIDWLEEPFPAHDFRSYAALAATGSTPLAAGENHYLRYDFERLAQDGVITVWQPDLSKCGGISEALRIAKLAEAHGVRLHPHTSVTGLNVAASLHFLAALPNAGYFEADYASFNPLRTELCSPVAAIDGQGECWPPRGPGLGIAIDESALCRFPVVRGAGYV